MKTSPSPYKIAVCGGHFTPAFALMESLQSEGIYDVFFIGRKYASAESRSVSIEYRTLQKMDLPFFTINAGKLQRYISFKSLMSLLAVPVGLFQSLILLLKIRPDAVISFGGYIALHVCPVAFLLGIPVITHEQTVTLGLTNRIIARISKVLCLGWKDTRNIPPHTNSVYTGNPVRLSLINPVISPVVRFGNPALPLIFVTGGSQGSVSINRMVFALLPSLLGRYRILHQTGSSFRDRDFLEAEKIIRQFPANQRKNYRPVKRVDLSDVGYILKTASLVISRSGANTVYELGVTKTPAILIPLPWSAGSEQLFNAQKLKEHSGTVIIRQNELDKNSLMKAIENMISASGRKKRTDAAYKSRKVTDVFTPFGASNMVKVIKFCLAPRS